MNYATAAAEQGVPVDRFARKIARFWEKLVQRARGNWTPTRWAANVDSGSTIQFLYSQLTIHIVDILAQEGQLVLHNIIFPLTQDAEGYPPVAAEQVWAIQRNGQFYEIDTIPFFITAATLGDIVEASTTDGKLHYTRTIHHSTNSLIRVVWYEGAEPATLRQELERLGCSTELFQQYHLLAVNVPASTDLDTVSEYLLNGHNQDLWDYEEAILRQWNATREKPV